MTIGSTAPQIEYIENGVTLAHAVPFQFQATTDLVVSRIAAGVETFLTLGADYIVAGGDGSTGTVTKTSGGTPGTALRIRRQTARAQSTDYTSGDDFPAETHEAALDRAMSIDQEQDVRIDDVENRAVRVPVGEQAIVLPTAAARAGKFQAYDALGAPIAATGTGNDPDLRADLAAPGGFALINGARQPLSVNRNYYVRADGSDLNSGLANTAGGAFLTAQKAIDVIYATLDLAGQEVTVNLADNLAAGAVSVIGFPLGGRDAGSQPIRIVSNPAAPATLSIIAGNRAYVLLDGVKVQNAAGIGLLAQDYATIEHRNCTIGACLTEAILSLHCATVRAIGPTTVNGNSNIFVHATKRSIVDFSGQTLTFVGGPVFPTYLWGINDASVDLDSATIVGTATGGIVVHDNGILNASSVTGKWTGGTAPEVNDGGMIAVADQLINRTFYVRKADGNDANDGMQNSAAHAFATIQGAVDAVSKLPYNPIAWASGLGASISIVLVGGPYNETVTLRELNYLSGTIIGDEVTPANVTINGPTYGIQALGIRTPWYVRGVKITATAGDCLHAEQGAQITYRNVEFGAASGAHVGVVSGGRIFADGNYKIIAGANYHAFARGPSLVDINGVTVTVTGTPAFATAFALAELCGVIRPLGATFVGGATGVRYIARTNGVIDTNGGGANFLPGNAAGSTATGGQYV